MQGIDPLPIAATLWESTHAIESAMANQVGEIDKLINFSRKYQANGRADAVDHRINETNPILGPEAG